MSVHYIMPTLPMISHSPDRHWRCLVTILLLINTASAGPLGLMGREPARQTSEPGSNPSWDATVHPVCETFNVMHVV